MPFFLTANHGAAAPPLFFRGRKRRQRIGAPALLVTGMVDAPDCGWGRDEAARRKPRRFRRPPGTALTDRGYTMHRGPPQRQAAIIANFPKEP